MIQAIAAVMLAGIAVTTASPTAAGSPQPRTTTISTYCASEDASAPADSAGCLWDATRQGNGQGWSYVALPRNRWVPLLRVPTRLDKTHALGIRYDTQWLTTDGAVMVTVLQGRSVVMGRSWWPWGNL